MSHLSKRKTDPFVFSDHPPYLISQSICEGREFCTLAEFEAFTADLRPDDWEAECRLEQDPVVWMVTVVSVTVTALLLTVLLASVVISLVRRRTEWQRRAHHQNDFEYSPINRS